MKKLKKSLAIILAIMMIASFTPLFASAAQVTCNKTNCVLVEAPKVSYGDGEPVQDLVLEPKDSGYTWADITVTGGKITYNGTEVEGKFVMYASRLTRALAIGSNTVWLSFEPTDTTNFKKATWYSMASTPLTDWPTVTLKGEDVTIQEAPTGLVLTNQYYSSTVFTGGKVTLADGTDVTAEGQWRAVNDVKATESGEIDVKWVCSSYNENATTVKAYVTVKTMKTTFSEAPTCTEKVYGSSGKLVSNLTASSFSGGKVLDENGTDVTSKGSWAAYGNPDMYIFKTTEIDVQWTATGYEPVEAKVTVEVTNPKDTNYNITKQPVLSAPETYAWHPGITMGDVCAITPGEVKDDNGNVIDGDWSVYVVNGTSMALKIGTNTFYGKFTPTDTNLKAINFSGTLRETCNVVMGEIELGDDFMVVLNYGQKYTMPLKSRNYSSSSGKDLDFSNIELKTQGVEVQVISWDLETFDPSTQDYGSITYVEAKITPTDSFHYNPLTATIPVKIQPFTYGQFFYATGLNNGSVNAFIWDDGLQGNDVDKGIATFSVKFTNPRLLGNVVITATNGTNTYDVATVSPDENGVFDFTTKWTAPENGKYTATFTYVASENDTAVFSEEKFKVATREFEVNAVPLHTITVKIGDKTIVREVYEGNRAQFNIVEEYGVDVTPFAKWKITDASGKEVVIKNIIITDPTDMGEWITVDEMPAHDLVFTAMTASGSTDAADGGNGILDSFLAFWNKIVNFIVKIYQMMYDMFKF